ncbi:MAG: tRNA uridine-5-carboxymethylaminomethyl(34) synthesis GTPase MnmE [Chlorobi bacterium]|nr:tRNA uridine-5-carboxymethylaminomethyl(34) synthesis GTPase MnmE [Chlorobiota bacterium]
MEQLRTDTICALSTPPGIGGLAVVRLSGPQAIAIADACFRGKNQLLEARTHTIHYGQIVRADGSTVDHVTAAVFRAPHSYTGEDVVEITCHGGYVMYRLVIETLLEHGARIAEAGEFTRRAFLNGKMDLMQVESVADIIHNQVVAAQELAIKQLGGSFTQWVRTIRDDLERVAAVVEVELDFAHEDLEFADRDELRRRLNAIVEDCRRFIRSYTGAEILRHGLRVGIVGFPNAGKSSLFNALLGRQRAIVSPQPGTTRDYIEEALAIGRALVRLYDTAGFRDSDDAIEVEGIALARSILEQCNVVLVVNDLTEGQNHSDGLAASLRAEFPTIKHMLVQNKCDCVCAVPPRSENEVVLSARTGQGISTLVGQLQQYIEESTAELDRALINERHVAALRIIEQHLVSAIAAVDARLPGECIALDIRTAVEELSTLIGERWTNDLLDRIFAQFCIGK